MKSAGIHKLAWAGLLVVVFWTLVAILAPWLVPHSPQQTFLELESAAPHAGFWLGHDELGRDILSRLIMGSRISLPIGFCVIALSAGVGVILGMVVAWLGGWLEKAFLFISDLFQAFPGFLLSVALTAVLRPGFMTLVWVLSVTGWVGFARLARGEVLKLKDREFVQAARALSVPFSRLMFWHLLPNMVGPLLVQVTFAMAGVILTESALSFLGLGLPPELASWGRMLDGGTANMLIAPHVALFPGLAIMSLVLGFNLLGDGIRDWLDPKE